MSAEPQSSHPHDCATHGNPKENLSMLHIQQVWPAATNTVPQRSTANIRTLNLRLQHFSAPQIGCMYIHLCKCTCYHVLPCATWSTCSTWMCPDIPQIVLGRTGRTMLEKKQKLDLDDVCSHSITLSCRGNPVVKKMTEHASEETKATKD